MSELAPQNAIRLIDSHAHLDMSRFDADRDEVIQRATQSGVTSVINVGIDLASSQKTIEMAQRYPAILAAVGVHPQECTRITEKDVTALSHLARRPQVIAIGEIGLDFYVENYDRTVQEFYFSEQLKLAREFDLPVLLHSRRAVDVILKYLRQIKLRGGIAHAFNGSRQQADEFIKLGFKLGFGGATTHSRATRLRELATLLPLDSLVLETDAPDIPPDFLGRGVPNKPEYLPRIAQTLADLRGIPVEEIARATTANARAVLPKLNF